MAPRRGFVCPFVCSDYKSLLFVSMFGTNTLDQVPWKRDEKRGKVIGGIKVSFMNVIRAGLTGRDGPESSQPGVSGYLLVLKVFAVGWSICFVVLWDVAAFGRSRLTAPSLHPERSCGCFARQAWTDRVWKSTWSIRFSISYFCHGKMLEWKYYIKRLAHTKNLVHSEMTDCGFGA